MERERERKGGWGSPSAVLILEVSVVECVGMGKTKYSSGGEERQGKTQNVEMNWPEHQKQETLSHVHLSWVDRL